MRGSGPSRPDRLVLGVDVPPEHDDRNRARPGPAQCHDGRLRARSGRPGVIKQQDPAIRHRRGLEPVRIKLAHPVVIRPGDEFSPAASQVRGNQGPQRVRADPAPTRRHDRQVRWRPADPGPPPAALTVVTQKHEQQRKQEPPGVGGLVPNFRPPGRTPDLRGLVPDLPSSIPKPGQPDPVGATSGPFGRACSPIRPAPVPATRSRRLNAPFH